MSGRNINSYHVQNTNECPRYEAMLVHNQRYEAGEVTWWKKVTKHYDLTIEEIEQDLGIGNNSYLYVPLFIIIF